jgi:class 3 adenylate cyclase/tetratricopeptide (TPR) repeat protein
MVTCKRCGSASPAGSRFCARCGAAIPEETASGDTRKVVTALFCDVVGSTELASELDPEAMHRVLRNYFEEISAILIRHGGTIEKFAGDAVFAVFGIPTLHEDDALRAVRAAAEIRERLPGLAASVGLQLEFHIGLNTGLVHTDEERSIAIGDAVNVAARLQQTAARGEILLGSDTMRLVRGAVVAEPLEPLRLKGRADPVRAYRLLEVDATASAVQFRIEGPLVGREAELRLLQNAWGQTLAERRSHQMTVIAPAGTGKSRLVEELLAELETGATVLRGRCLHYGEGITFWPLREALIPLGDVARQVLDGLVRGGAAAPEELFLSVRRLLESLARERPVALLIEDVHWAEVMLLDLLDHLVQLTRDAAILVICTARNELLDNDDGSEPRPRSGSTLRLKPLVRSACDALLDQIGGDLTPDARDKVISASEGNPLFIQEMVSLARESGKVEVPPSIQALLAARIEQLSRLQREPLERGSVEGYVFHIGAVKALLPERSWPDLTDHLSELRRKELIVTHPATVAGQAAYRFRHHLLRDTAYERLPLTRRAELHERFTDWLKDEAADAADLDEIVGWHLEQATRYLRELRLEVPPGLPARAARHLYRAGIHAGERGDISAAQNLLERTLALAPEDPLRLDVSVALAERAIEAGDLGRADEILSELEQRGPVPPQAVLSRIEWRCFSGLAEVATVLDSTLPAVLAEFERAQDERGLARTHWLLFLLRWQTSQATLAAEQARLAAEHARKADDLGLRSRALGWYIATLIYGPRKSSEVAARLDVIERERPGPYLAACLALGRSEVERRQGRFAAAHELAGKAVTGFRELGMPLMVATSEQSDGMIALSEGDAAAARAALERSEAILGEFQAGAIRASTLALLAHAHERLGAIEEAMTAAEQAEALSAPGEVFNFVLTHSARARLAAMAGDAGEAERWGRSAVEHATRSDFVGLQAEANLALARALFMQGRGDDARAAATRALQLFQGMEDLPGAAAAAQMMEGRDLEETAPLVRSGTQGGAGTRRSLRGR